jgi:hypothetical protein
MGRNDSAFRPGSTGPGSRVDIATRSIESEHVFLPDITSLSSTRREIDILVKISAFVGCHKLRNRSVNHLNSNTLESSKCMPEVSGNSCFPNMPSAYILDILISWHTEQERSKRLKVGELGIRVNW